MSSRERRMTIYELSKALGITVRQIQRRRRIGFCIPYEIIDHQCWYNREEVAKYLSIADPVGRFVANELSRTSKAA